LARGGVFYGEGGGEVVVSSVDKLSLKNWITLKAKDEAFTLVELLVVISIIGMLAGLMSVAIPKAMESGKKAKAKGELTAIVAAVKAYKQEYGRWPGTDTSSDTTFQDANSKYLLAALSGTSSALVENPKSVRFLEGADTDGTMKDPWKTQYVILVDTDDSNSMTYNNKAIRVSVLAVSFGKDQKQDATPGSGDDVFSTDLK
jgi:prepilin-type N-terminal cleavage/methylation domain-containing protein